MENKLETDAVFNFDSSSQPGTNLPDLPLSGVLFQFCQFRFVSSVSAFAGLANLKKTTLNGNKNKTPTPPVRRRGLMPLGAAGKDGKKCTNRNPRGPEGPLRPQGPGGFRAHA